MTILDYSDYEYSDDKIIPCDVHPNYILNNDIGNLLAQDIKKLE
jgi:hypothetical protein